MEGMGLILTPKLVRHLLGPLSLSGPMTNISWLIATPNSSIGRYNLPLAIHGSLHLPPPTCPRLMHAICELQSL